MNCVRNLVELANEWKDEEDSEITQNEFISRLDKDFTMEIRGTSYIIYFHADEMFADHGVVYRGNIDDSEDFETDVE